MCLYETAFPGLLGVPVSAADADRVPYVDLVAPALCLYAAWWILFTAWMLIHGRHHGHNNASGSVHDTVYHYTLGSKAAIGRDAHFFIYKYTCIII